MLTFLHHTHATCGEIHMSPYLSCGEIWNFSTWRELLGISTSAMWRNLKLLHTWRYFRFLNYRHAWKAEISSNGKFFSKNMISEISDNYDVCTFETSLIIWGWPHTRSPNSSRLHLSKPNSSRPHNEALIGLGHIQEGHIRIGLIWANIIQVGLIQEDHIQV